MANTIKTLIIATLAMLALVSCSTREMRENLEKAQALQAELQTQMAELQALTANGTTPEISAAIDKVQSALDVSERSLSAAEAAIEKAESGAPWWDILLAGIIAAATGGAGAWQIAAKRAAGAMAQTYLEGRRQGFEIALPSKPPKDTAEHAQRVQEFARTDAHVYGRGLRPITNPPPLP